MCLIKVITDEDINLKSQEFKNPRIRYASRENVVKDTIKVVKEYLKMK